MKPDLKALLRDRGIQPSAQRLAIADYVLATDEHPSADRVWKQVHRNFPMISRATVYNTLHLFAEKGLLQKFVFGSEGVVFDPRVERHHHFIDDATGRIYDLPWSAVELREPSLLKGFKVHNHHVVLRGSRIRGGARRLRPES